MWIEMYHADARTAASRIPNYTGARERATPRHIHPRRSRRRLRRSARTASATVTLAQPSSDRGPRRDRGLGTFGGVVQREKVLVAPENAITLASLELTPACVIGGQPVAVAVTLTKQPAGGAQITFHATRRNIVSMPATVSVPEGAITATFVVATERVHGIVSEESARPPRWPQDLVKDDVSIQPPYDATYHDDFCG
jgi:hypothetical protein